MSLRPFVSGSTIVDPQVQADREVELWWRQREAEAMSDRGPDGWNLQLPCEACGFVFSQHQHKCPRCGYDTCEACS